MKRENLTEQGRLDRRIITAMVMSTDFLRDVEPMYRPEYLPGDFARVVAGWCLEHYRKYAAAPGLHIQDYYDIAIRTNTGNPKVLELVEPFLAGLSKSAETEELNIPFLLAETEKWWTQRELEHHIDDVKDALEKTPETALKLAEGFKGITRAGVVGFNPFKEPSRLQAALLEQAVPLLHFRGALGQLVNRHMTRNSLIALMGPEKRGKSFWLNEFMLRACMARNNVALFEVGDMTESQYLRRTYSRMTGLPKEEADCGDITIPALDCRLNQTGECTMPCRSCNSVGIMKTDEDGMNDPVDVPADYRPCHACRRNREMYVPEVLYHTVRRPEFVTVPAAEKVNKMLLHRMQDKELRVSIHPNFSINVKGIMSVLDGWKARDGYVPDVIIIDYADILDNEEGVKDERQGQNVRWGLLRKMSQVYPSLVIVASQTNRASYGAETITEEMCSEDKRKLSHVNGAIGLNQYGDEKERKVQRLSWILSRESPYTVWDQVVCLQDLNVANPHVDSYWRPRKPKAGKK